MAGLGLALLSSLLQMASGRGWCPQREEADGFGDHGDGSCWLGVEPLVRAAGTTAYRSSPESWVPRALRETPLQGG